MATYPKKLATLGDALLNAIVSACITLVTEEAFGTKVPDRVILKAAQKVGLKQKLQLGRISQKELSNLVEALVAKAWLSGRLSLDKTIEQLATKLKKLGLKRREDLMVELVVELIELSLEA